MVQASARKMGRSVAAILIGVVVTVVLSLAVDEVFHLLHVYPPWDEPMNDVSDNALALGYRVVIQTFAGVIALRFAGYAPGVHAIVFGTIGLALGTLGATATGANTAAFGPVWYPWALAVSAIPCAAVSWWIVARRGVAR
jgi:hypothetical protein